MQPYQQANKEIRRQGELPLKTLATAGSFGASALGGIALGRVLPFLSKFIPQDLAIKGLSKIDPRFGKFINKALSEGKSFEEIKDFIRNKASPEESKEIAIPAENQPELSPSGFPPKREQEQQEPPPQQMQEQTSQQRSPLDELAGIDESLAQFIKGHIQNGKTPEQAAAIAKNDSKNSRSVRLVEKNTKENFVDYISRLFGNQKIQGNKQVGGQSKQPYQQASQSQQGGQGQQALMAILQKLQQSRGGK